VILPGLRTDIMQKIVALEDELGAAGLDNRDVPKRKVNSRRAHLGTGYLQDADYDSLIAFYEHLRGVAG